MTQADHGERKKEKAALPNRRDAAPGRATLPPGSVLACVHTEQRRRLPPPGTLSFFHPRGLAAPARRATHAPSVTPAPLPRDSLSQDVPSPERNRLAMRAPATTTWKTQSVFPPSRSQRLIRGQCTAGTRLAASRPPPQPPRARARGVGDTAPGAHCSPRRGRQSPRRGRPAGSSRVPHGKPAGLEKGRPEERQTPLPVRLHLLHVAHNAPAAEPGRGRASQTRLTVIAALHQPLSVGFSSSCDVQINPAPMQTFSPLASKLCFSLTSEQSAGREKERKIRSEVPRR